MARETRVTRGACVPPHLANSRRNFVGLVMVRAAVWRHGSVMTLCALSTIAGEPSGWFRCCSPLAFLCTRAALALVWLGVFVWSLAASCPDEGGSGEE